MLSTYFIRPNTSTDPSPFPSLFKDEDHHLKQIHAVGRDLQSNFVIGSPLFDQFEQGTGDETYRLTNLTSWFGQNVPRYDLRRNACQPFASSSIASCRATRRWHSRSSYLRLHLPTQSLLGNWLPLQFIGRSECAPDPSPFQLNYNREFELRNCHYV